MNFHKFVWGQISLGNANWSRGKCTESPFCRNRSGFYPKHLSYCGQNLLRGLVTICQKLHFSHTTEMNLPWAGSPDSQPELFISWTTQTANTLPGQAPSCCHQHCLPAVSTTGNAPALLICFKIRPDAIGCLLQSLLPLSLPRQLQPILLWPFQATESKKTMAFCLPLCPNQ